MSAGTPLTGNTMSFYTGGTPAVSVHTAQWEITVEAANGMYASNSTSGWKKSVTGVKSWSGSVKKLIHDGESPGLNIGAEYACEFYGVATTDKIVGTVQITKVGPITFDAESGDPVAVDFEFNGSGAFTVTGNALDILA